MAYVKNNVLQYYTQHLGFIVMTLRTLKSQIKCSYFISLFTIDISSAGRIKTFMDRIWAPAVVCPCLVDLVITLWTVPDARRE